MLRQQCLHLPSEIDEVAVRDDIIGHCVLIAQRCYASVLDVVMLIEVSIDDGPDGAAYDAMAGEFKN